MVEARSGSVLNFCLSRMYNLSSHLSSGALRRRQSRTDFTSTIPGALTNLVCLTQLLQQFADTTPFSPLKVTCSIALVILESVQGLLKIKEDFLFLGRRVAELVAAICCECQTQWESDSSIPPDLYNKIERLLRDLVDIQHFVQKQAKLKRFTRFLKAQELKDSLDLHNKRLDDAFRLFSVTSMIGIQRSLTSISGSKNPSEQQFALTSRDIRREQSLKTSEDVSICHGKCFAGRQGWVKAIIKNYPSDENGKSRVLQEVQNWKRVRHPNVHELLGYSTHDEENVVVYSDYLYPNARLYLDGELQQNNPCHSFMSVTRMLQGIASGLEYLRWHSALTKGELEACGEEKNCVVNADGQVIIGHNLIVNENRIDRQPVYKDADEWLKEVFYLIGSRLIYGNSEPDWADWNWVTTSLNGERTRHARILESVFCFLQPTFSALVRDFEVIMDTLRCIPKDFQRVRDILLEVRNGQIYYIYRPRIPLDVNVLDVGYIKPSDGTFVAIDNYRVHLALKPKETPAPILLGAASYESAKVSGQECMIRHRFHRPNYATLRRMTSSEAMPDTETLKAWRFFAKDAPRLFSEHSLAHPEMRIQDLILVTKVETDLRFSTLAWNAEGATLEPPPTVQHVDFFEYENAKISKPWGYWVIDGAIANEYEGATYSETRCAQNIMFLQLEEADYIQGSR